MKTNETKMKKMMVKGVCSVALAGTVFGTVAPMVENNVAMAEEKTSSDSWWFDDLGDRVWDRYSSESAERLGYMDIVESGRTLSGKLWVGNTVFEVEMFTYGTANGEEPYIGTVRTAADGSFSLTVPCDIPVGYDVAFSNLGRQGVKAEASESREKANAYANAGTGFRLKKGLFLEDNGGDVTPEPEKPTEPDNGGDVTPDFSTNTWEQNGSDWYCYDSKGTMITGWMQDGNNWYYFNQDGSMHKGWLESNGLWYSFRDNGQMKRGWEKINGTQYFFTDTGRLAYDEWLPYGSDWFYVNKKGRMLQNEWQPYNGAWYYFDAKGAMVTNQYVGGSYVDASGRAI